MTIRRNVEYILRKKQMNKAELAERAGITASSLSVLLDSTNIGLKSIQKIAKGLGVKASDLIQNPPLSDKNYFHEEEEEQKPKIPIKATFVCPACGSKLVVTVEE